MEGSIGSAHSGPCVSGGEHNHCFAQPKRFASLTIKMDARVSSQRIMKDMSFNRPIVFWIAMLAAVVAAVALLREVLLPFVAGAVLAYVFNPLASRLERLGINRLLATLLIVACVFALILAVLFLTV